jgi:hypothetical protein
MSFSSRARASALEGVGCEVLDRGREEVGDLASLPAALLLEVLEQDVAGHAEQVVAKAGRLADPCVGLDAAQEGALDQVVGVVVGLVVEEPGDRLVVALEQLRTGAPITAGTTPRRAHHRASPRAYHAAFPVGSGPHRPVTCATETFLGAAQLKTKRRPTGLSAHERPCRAPR